MNPKLLLIALLATSTMSACTAEQVYNSGQAWQQNQCGRYQDKADYDRCKGSTAQSYEAYRREVESAGK
jgi:hypothetical protein